MTKNHEFFTSESVTEGHPDKMADQISDAILDAILKEDPYARVACETLVKTGAVLLAGEVTTTANIDVEAVVRNTVNGIRHSKFFLCNNKIIQRNILIKHLMNNLIS